MPRSKKLSDRMRAESRTQILSAARRLFADNGYFKCRVSDIAQAADMSQGNVYWYFTSKEEVLKAVLAVGFEAVERVLEETSLQTGSGLQQLTDLTDKYIYHRSSLLYIP
ncbi:MAG: helix-turn-helix transcriptional regulator [Dehalococcoidia bacterium]|nr:helix-turn-helix transcriptional regulator [Dehalococcoidia bacterium]